MMPGTGKDRPVRQRAIWLVITVLILASVSSASADDARERRVRMGIRLFPRLLAADVELDRKVADDGRLLLVVFHSGDSARAGDLIRELTGPPEDPQTIRRLPLTVQATSSAEFGGLEGRIAGIFIADEPDAATLARIVRFGIENGIIVYSPFDGHVERGVSGGLSIGAKVELFVNLATLRASGIELKDLFLKVTKVYQ